MKVINKKYCTAIAAALVFCLPQFSSEQTRDSSAPVPNVDVRSSLNVRTDIERAMWVWNPEDIIYSVGTAKEDLFRFCSNHAGVRDADAPEFARHPINRLFFYAHGFLVSGQEEKDSLRSFLREAHARHIAVDFLDGEPTWISSDSGEANRVMDSVLRFNALGYPEERFDGVQFDVEPYRITGWYSETIWNGYIHFLKSMRAKLNASGETLRLGVTIPRWYDIMLGMNALKEIYSQVDCAAVMDYVSDEQTLVNDVDNEIALGDAMGVQVYVGVEAGQMVPSASSFLEKGWLAMERELARVNATYMFDKSFAGVAIHKYTTYDGMRRTGRSLEYANAWTTATNPNVAGLAGCSADIVVLNDAPGIMTASGAKEMERNIRAVQYRAGSDISRVVLASVPLIESAESRIAAEAGEQEAARSAQLVKGGGVGEYTVNYYAPAWTGKLAKKTAARIADCMNAGLDGVVLDAGAALATAKLYAVPEPENKVVDLLAQAAQTARSGVGRGNAVIIARCGNSFIHRLDDEHYRLFMALVDGVMPEGTNTGDMEYARHGVKVFSAQNFSATNDGIQTADGGAPGGSAISASFAAH